MSEYEAVTVESFREWARRAPDETNPERSTTVLSDPEVKITDRPKTPIAERFYPFD